MIHPDETRMSSMVRGTASDVIAGSQWLSVADGSCRIWRLCLAFELRT